MASQNSASTGTPKLGELGAATRTASGWVLITEGGGFWVFVWLRLTLLVKWIAVLITRLMIC